ncbi:hypothetical protein GGE56_007739 [Rhizobium leguminosarum]|nr:hypothetical protein [Rhizobium leguminosarum]MBB6299375.1 hypothetical protein [Rhizobium leguminosarum]
MVKRRSDLLERGFMILNAIAEKLKRQSKDDFKGRQFEAWLIIQAVSWFALSVELSRSRGNVQGTRLRGGSQQRQSLGVGLCADD